MQGDRKSRTPRPNRFRVRVQAISAVVGLRAAAAQSLLLPERGQYAQASLRWAALTPASPLCRSCAQTGCQTGRHHVWYPAAAEKVQPAPASMWLFKCRPGMRRPGSSRLPRRCWAFLSAFLLFATLLTAPWWWPWILWRHATTSFVTVGPGGSSHKLRAAVSQHAPQPCVRELH